jgi:thymidylate synthase
MKENAETQYLEIMKDILENGTEKGDRTGTGTYSKFAPTPIKIDLSKEFPLMTTKKMFTRGMIHELLWFLKGDTNIKYLQDNNVKFWDSWADEDGNLGPVYGKQLRDIRHHYWVIPKVFEKPKALNPCPLAKPLVPVFGNFSESKTVLLGKTFESPESGAYQVIEELPATDKYNHTRFLVQFRDTGCMVDTVYSSVVACTVKDLYKRSVFGIGYYGHYDESDPFNDLLKDIWRDMIRRCYYTKSKAYKSYGAKGVHVSESWHCFANFQKEVKKIPGWSLKVCEPDNYSLDKDIKLASNRYGIDTCMWASIEEQSWNTTQNMPFSAVSPDGKSEMFLSIGEMARKYNMNLSAIHRCLNGKLKKHKNWTNFTYLLSPEPGAVLRVKIIDQLKELIYGIKVDPDSRRHMISLWNPHDLHRMNLPPCHGIVTNFYVCNGILHCSTYQRSADAFLGLPVNLASYALLVELIAHCTNLKPGTLTYNIGDCHIYKNHLDQVEKQLGREILPSPKLVLSSDCPRNILEIEEQHIKIEEYQSHDTIKAPVSV